MSELLKKPDVDDYCDEGGMNYVELWDAWQAYHTQETDRLEKELKARIQTNKELIQEKHKVMDDLSALRNRIDKALGEIKADKELLDKTFGNHEYNMISHKKVIDKFTKALKGEG